MVVIKETRPALTKLYGNDFISRLDHFSGIIGYTLEEEGQEIRVEFNPDRPDLFSFTSLHNSMEIYAGKNSWKPLSFSKSNLDFIIDDSVRKLRPYTVGFCCEGGPIGEHFRDLIDFQEKIHSSTGKDRSKVSIGIHDTKNLTGPIYYKAYMSDDITFTTYDGEISGTAKSILSKHPKGKQYAHLIPSDDKVPIIEDSKQKVLSMPPVINGNATAVSPETSSFFIDVTGTDLKALRDSFYQLSYFFFDLGYVISLSNFDDLSESRGFDGRKITVSSDAISELTGTGIPGIEVKEILEKMGYRCSAGKGSYTVEIPGNRGDVMGPADIIEDIAKGFGYDNIKPSRPQLNLIGDEVSHKVFQNLVREVMVGLGHQEIMSYVVTAKRFFGDVKYEGALEVKNPKSLDFSVVRDRLALGALDFLRINKRRNLPQDLFEIGEVIVGGEQHTNLCILKADSKTGYSDIKQILDALMVRLGIQSFQVRPGKVELLVEGRAGNILLNGQEIGVIGEVHPAALESFELKNPVSCVEINLTDLSSVINEKA